MAKAHRPAARPRPRSESAVPWTLAATLWLAALAWLHLRLRDMAFDDAYIHLRIARNLLRHGQALFNPGERVMVTSSPLWTIVLAMLRVPGHAAVLPAMEALLLWTCGVLAFLICRRTLPCETKADLRWNTGAALAGALLTPSVVLASSLGLMETPLAVALMLGAWWCALGSGLAALPLLALAACTRLELLPLLLSACIAWLWAKKGATPVIVAGLVIAAVAGWTWMQFRVLHPNSVDAKRLVYSYTFSQAAQQFVALRWRSVFPALAMLAFVGAFALSVYGSQMKSRHASTCEQNALRRVLPLAAILVGLVLVLEYVANRTVMFEWYKPLFTVPLVLGFLLFTPDRRSPRMVRAALRLCQAVAVLCFGAAPLIHAKQAVRAAVQQTSLAKSRIDGGDSARVQGYLQIGSVLRETCPEGRLMTPEIGALGWTFGGYVYDAFGIASPGALQYQPLRSGAGVGGVPAAYVTGTLPDVIVSYTILDTEVRASAGLRRRYDLLQLPPSPKSNRGGALDSGWHSSPYLDVWLRTDGVCPLATTRDALRRKLE